MGVLEAVGHEYLAKLDEWLLDPVHLAGMGFRGPWSASRTFRNLLEGGGIFIAGVRREGGDPVGLCYAYDDNHVSAELHCSVFEGPHRSLLWARAIDEALRLLFVDRGYQRVSTLVRPELVPSLKRRFGAREIGALCGAAHSPHGMHTVHALELTRSEYLERHIGHHPARTASKRQQGGSAPPACADSG